MGNTLHEPSSASISCCGEPISKWRKSRCRRRESASPRQGGKRAPMLVSGGHKKLEFHLGKTKFNNEGSAMRPIFVTAVAVISLLLGVSIGYAAKYKGAGIEVIRGKSDKDAGYAALTEAEHLANGGSWEL